MEREGKTSHCVESVQLKRRFKYDKYLVKINTLLALKIKTGVSLRTCISMLCS